MGDNNSKQRKSGSSFTKSVLSGSAIGGAIAGSSLAAPTFGSSLAAIPAGSALPSVLGGSAAPAIGSAARHAGSLLSKSFDKFGWNIIKFKLIIKSLINKKKLIF